MTRFFLAKRGNKEVTKKKNLLPFCLEEKNLLDYEQRIFAKYARLADLETDNAEIETAKVEKFPSDSVLNAENLKFEEKPLAQDSPPSLADDLPTFTATPAQLEFWHNQIKSDLQSGIFFYNARRDFGDNFQKLKSLIQGAAFEKFKIGYDRYSGSYIFVIDSSRYIKAQTFVANDDVYRRFLESDSEVELNYKTPDAEKVLKLINNLLISSQRQK